VYTINGDGGLVFSHEDAELAHEDGAVDEQGKSKGDSRDLHVDFLACCLQDKAEEDGTVVILC
jgi:hypothetical protein